jgi:hypothetical protein
MLLLGNEDEANDMRLTLVITAKPEHSRRVATKSTLQIVQMV